jgi:phytoene desaturase
VRGEYQELDHHNIFFSNDYQYEFTQIFDQLRAPEDPTVYISVTKKNDADHAPPGHENWFLLINMPYLTGKEEWDKVINQMRKRVIEKLRFHGIDIEKYIIHEDILTPRDFYQLYESNRGSIYGLSSNSRATAFTRPSNRSRVISGLFFAGGSVHPGGGVPLAILSGKMAADLIGEQEGLEGALHLSNYLKKHMSENDYFN